MGAALRFVISPLAWTALGTTMVVFVVAETHHAAKRHFPKRYYFEPLRATNSKLLFWIDNVLDDLRDFVQAVTEHPQQTLLAVRDKIDAATELVDLNQPLLLTASLQQGFLFGGVIGVLGGL